MKHSWIIFFLTGCTNAVYPQPVLPPVQEPIGQPVVVIKNVVLATPAAPAAPAPAPAPEPELELEIVPPEPPWSWALVSNHGMRVDSGGAGWFGARRGSTRTHSGIDLLADVGTPVLAVCDGQFRTRTKNPYGNYIQLVCELPFETSTITSVSILYGHLDRFEQESPEYSDVKARQVIGYVGKSGNASGKTIMSHLHLEMLVHNGVDAAKSEEHKLRAKSPAQDYTELSDKLSQCLLGFKPGPRGFNSGHKFDPFLLLSCLANRPVMEETDLMKLGRSFSTYYHNSMGLSKEQSALIMTR